MHFTKAWQVILYLRKVIRSTYGLDLIKRALTAVVETHFCIAEAITYLEELQPQELRVLPYEVINACLNFIIISSRHDPRSATWDLWECPLYVCHTFWLRA